MSVAVGDVPVAGLENSGATPTTVLGTIDVETERRHAEEITPIVRDLLIETATGMRALDRLVVDVGPGRFTGLRVGLATIRAMAFGLDVPVVPLTSLEILAGADDLRSLDGAAGEPHPTVTAVVDARREEVFQQTYVGAVAVGEPVVGRPEALAPLAAGIVVGDGADRYAAHYRAAGLDALPARNPTAAAMLALSAGRPGRPGPTIEPLYLRGPDANPNVRTRPTSAASPPAGRLAGEPAGETVA